MPAKSFERREWLQKTSNVCKHAQEIVTIIDKRYKMLCTHLQFTKGRQKSGSISLDLTVLFTQTKLHGEPVQLYKEQRKIESTNTTQGQATGLLIAIQI